MGICNLYCLLICVFLIFFYFCFSLLFFVEPGTQEGWFFQRVYLYIWVIAGHELGTFSIRIHNSLTVYDNSRALKLDNFYEFQNVSSNSPQTPPPSLPPHSSVNMTHCIWKSLCDSTLIYNFEDESNLNWDSTKIQICTLP